jgi:hypothetical protein
MDGNFNKNMKPTFGGGRGEHSCTNLANLNLSSVDFANNSKKHMNELSEI